MVKFSLFLFGFGLTIVGGIYIILYLNLTTMGYNFQEYVNFIIRRPECWTLVVGIIIILFNLPKENKDEIYLRYSIKF